MYGIIVIISAHQITKRLDKMKSKISCLLLLLIFPFVLASAQTAGKEGKVITYKCKNDKLANALRKVERLSNYYKVQFAIEDVSPYKVTVDLKSTDAEVAVKQMLQGTKLKYQVKGRFIQVYLNRPKTSGNTVSGIITDSHREPLAGASVRVKETGIGMAADVNGRYRLNIEPGQTIEVSYVGMQTREEVFDGSATLNITLNEDKKNNLSNVVVTGIFTKPKENYTGAVTTISKEQIELYRGNNMLQTLKNIDASINMPVDNYSGSNPNVIPEINIRGTASLPTNMQEFSEGVQNSVNTPLIIMDGFEITLEKLMDYNDDEIESINILKDASATAIYGSRGANGVIVIVTKRPEAGKLKLFVETGTTIEVPDLTSYNLLNAAEKLQLEYDAGLYDNDSPIIDMRYKTKYNERLRRVLSGADTDWLSKPLRTGVGQDYKARLEGGSEDFRWGTSLGWKDTEGAMKDSKRQVFNGGITLMYQKNNFIIRNYTSVSINGSQESKYGTFSDYAKQQPYNSPYDEYGNVVKTFEPFFGDRETKNPLYDASLNSFNKSGYTNLTNNISLDWIILPELRLRGQFGIGSTQRASDIFYPAEHSLFTTDTQYSTDDGFLRRGSYTYGTGRSTNYSGSFTLAYNKVFADKHMIYAGLDYTMMQNGSYSYTFKAEGFSSEDITSIFNGRQYAQNAKPSGSKTLSRQVGFTGNVNYTFDNRYFLDASFREDGSSEYGSNNKFSPFWSLGIGWNVHNEPFLKSFKNVMNHLKFRGSMGQTGSQLSSNSGAFTSYSYITDNKYMNWVGANLTGLGNPDLTWQLTRDFNAGLEFGFFGDRLRGTFDVYNKTTCNLLSSMDLPLSTGFTSYMANIGEVKNTGFELSLSAYLIRNAKKHINWIVSGQIVHNKNEITKLSDAIKQQNEELLQSGADIATLFFEGKPQNSIYGVLSAGIDPSTGQELFYNKDGELTYTWDAKDKVYLGCADPKFRGNLGTTFIWNKLTLNFSFGYQWGGYTYNQTLLSKVEVTESTIMNSNVDARVLSDRWFQPGDETFFKAISNDATRATSRFVMLDNNFTLQSVGAQYRFDSPMVRSMFHCNSIVLALNMNDLFYLSTIKRERGTSYPYSRNIQASLKLSF